MHSFEIEFFVDADFAGLWSYEAPNDPVCVRSAFVGALSRE
jgi:hypothetical protein